MRRWQLVDHGHRYRRESDTGFQCRHCDWWVTNEERVSPFYLQNHGDCPTRNVGEERPRWFQQCYYAQVCLFQDGEHRHEQ